MHIRSNALCILSLCLPLWVQAAVSESEAAKLGQSLTPIGAERSGNSEGTIPEWTGGLPKDSGTVTNGFRSNPYPQDQPQFVITAANVETYQDKLSPGQLAMFKRYPDTYKIPVYETRRTARWPEAAYAIVKRNATQTKLIEGGNGLKEYSAPLAFPIPQNGLEVIWNHITRYRGGSFERTTTSFMTTPGGEYATRTEEERLAYSEQLTDYDPKKSKNILYYFTRVPLAPSREVGNVLLVHETLDQVKEPRMAWQYSSGQRRVRRAPQVAYDSPSSNNLRTNDQLDMFNGSPDRYDWKLVGKRELYVPYNSFRLADPSNKYDDIIKPGHIDQDKARYELHRVWEIVATLKPDSRHIYAKRHMFVDEDTWSVLEADSYDNRNNLWRVSENHTLPLYDAETTLSAAEITYDLSSGRYVSTGMYNEIKNAYKFGLKAKTSDFTPAALRTLGLR